LPFDPLNVIAEVLGEPADQMRNPANAGYLCPFRNGVCIKTSKLLEAPAPVCSIHRRIGGGAPPICTCPVRFYESNITEDVIRECWIGAPPENPRLAHEISMEKFGKVDLVISDVDRSSARVRRFLPVELQAVDITGTVLPSYVALTNSQMVANRPKYGLNWANVRKRFISQLIAKGYYCHHWGTRIVAVVQADLFEQFQRHARAAEVRLEESNIVFMLYQFVWNQSETRWNFKLERVVPTTHMNVMNAILYETPPLRADFEAKILSRIL
jgi:hypothetical protein